MITEATPLALKVPVVDYAIYSENNKPYYKIIRVDGSHQLFLSFLSLLRNFDREDLEVLCSSLEDSKRHLWFSKSQKLKTIRVMWSSHHKIYNHSDDLASREKISIDNVHFRSDAEQLQIVSAIQIVKTVSIRVNTIMYKLRPLVSDAWMICMRIVRNRYALSFNANLEVVTTAKLTTKVVPAAAATITVATTPITAALITAAPSAARRRKGLAIRDPEETDAPLTIIHTEPKSKNKGKEIMVQEPKTLKKQAQIEQDEAYARELEAKLNKNINWDDLIEQGALKRKTKSFEEKATKKQKLDEEVEELKKHLQIVPNDDDDVYTEAAPLALKVPVIDYAIYSKNNKPYYKIIRADGSHQFASSKPNNFPDDFLLTTLTYMFEKPDVEAQVWKNQRGVYGLAKVKSWRLLESCGVHIITFTTTQMILLVERRNPLTRFGVDAAEDFKDIHQGITTASERLTAAGLDVQHEKPSMYLSTLADSSGNILSHVSANSWKRWRHPVQQSSCESSTMSRHFLAEFICLLPPVPEALLLSPFLFLSASHSSNAAVTP
nr:hypothetical protein [Tanacetum cinerariifolium]